MKTIIRIIVSAVTYSSIILPVPLVYDLSWMFKVLFSGSFAIFGTI